LIAEEVDAGHLAYRQALGDRRAHHQDLPDRQDHQVRHRGEAHRSRLGDHQVLGGRGGHLELDAQEHSPGPEEEELAYRSPKSDDPEEEESACHLKLPAGLVGQEETVPDDRRSVAPAASQIPVLDLKQHDHSNCPGPRLK